MASIDGARHVAASRARQRLFRDEATRPLAMRRARPHAFYSANLVGLGDRPQSPAATLGTACGTRLGGVLIWDLTERERSRHVLPRRDGSRNERGRSQEP